MLTFKSYFLKEGGNVFTGVTEDIKQADVIPTVQHLERITGLPLLHNMLGTTGKAVKSGDVDLVVDNKTITKDVLVSRLQEFWKKNSVDTIGTKKSGISVHFLSPIWNRDGKETGKYVQVDFMFHDDPEYLKWFYAANEQAPLKGKDRNILLSAIAKNKGLTLSTSGLMSRDPKNKQLISRNPDAIAKALFDKNASAKDLNNIPAIIHKLIELNGAEEAKRIVSEAEVTTGHTFI